MGTTGIQEPRTAFVGRGEIVGCGAGITRSAIDKAVEAGALRPVRWPGRRKRVFRWADVVKAFGLG
jgi:hypothetical protein